MEPVLLCLTKWLSLIRNSYTWHCAICSSDITTLTYSNTPDMTLVNVRRPLGEWPRATGYLSPLLDIRALTWLWLNTDIQSYEALIAGHKSSLRWSCSTDAWRRLRAPLLSIISSFNYLYMDLRAHLSFTQGLLVTRTAQEYELIGCVPLLFYLFLPT